MAIRSLVVSFAVGLVLALGSPVPAQALIPKSEAGWAPKAPAVCKWPCVEQNFPARFDLYVNALDDMGTRQPTSAELLAAQKFQQDASNLNQTFELLKKLQQKIDETNDLRN